MQARTASIRFADRTRGFAHSGDGVRCVLVAAGLVSLLAGCAGGGKPAYVADGSVTPRFADGNYHAVNTTQPAYQPSYTPLPAGGDLRLADPNGGSGGSRRGSTRRAGPFGSPCCGYCRAAQPLVASALADVRAYAILRIGAPLRCLPRALTAPPSPPRRKSPSPTSRFRHRETLPPPPACCRPGRCLWSRSGS